MTRRWRTTGWIALGVLIALRVGFAGEASADVIVGIGVGIATGSAVLAFRGAPSLEPTADMLVTALRSAGLRPTRITQTKPSRSRLSYRVATSEGHDLFLPLRTQHDRSADVLTHLVQSVRFKPDALDEPFNSIQHKTEHEALCLTMAERAAVRVAHFDAIVGTRDGSIGIAENFIDGLPAHQLDHLSTQALDSAWEQVHRLHRAEIAHRALGLNALVVDDDGQTWLADFQRARLIATQRERSMDVAQLLTDTSTAVDPEVAVDSAIREMGKESVAAAIPFLQPLALPRSTRQALKGKGDFLKNLRQLVEERTGTEGAPLEQIERVRPRTIVTILALSLAFYLVLPQLADIQGPADAFVDANLAWAPWIIIGSALSYMAAAISLMGAVPQPIPFTPALRAQLAASFTGLIAPGHSGALAVGIRFLQRSGVDPAPAAASVGLNAGAGLVVHLALTLVFVLWNGSAGGLGSFSLPDATLILIVAGVAVALVGLSMLNRKFRNRVLGPARDAMKSVGSSLGSVLTNPIRIVQLFGGSIGVTLAYILAIVASVEAFGGGPSITQIGVGYLIAAAFGSFAPTPGGLGAFEAAMIAALTGFGMDSGAAVSATLSFRLATYWLPVIPGWVAFTWMQHHDEI
jgi:undecaprenyl-diphosphatase